MEISTQHRPEQSRYELTVDGTVVGFAEYREHGAERVFDHTVIEPAFRGQGLGAQLVQFALDDTRADGKAVVAACWYVGEFIDAHPEYADLVA
jgi:predicted GNAT family acetyltransferase